MEILLEILPVKTAGDLQEVTRLFQSYASSLEIDLSYQDFAEELASLPGKYAPPAGDLLLARNAKGEAIGCVAMRPIEPSGCCEMKRLYVSPQGRGAGIGFALARAIIESARLIGYKEMRLDSLPSMTKAIALYEKLGFVRVTRYYDSPVAGTVFLALPLETAILDGNITVRHSGERARSASGGG